MRTCAETLGRAGDTANLVYMTCTEASPFARQGRSRLFDNRDIVARVAVQTRSRRGCNNRVLAQRGAVQLLLRPET